ncbi:cell division protein FtsL [Peptoanaerobacter stomatis]|uniref:Cell division protein FtsL n=1 Tax=Peptoanaerobacter stomatis TaxID=796937 RepID=V9HVL7_9FIRM|nr:septum formation initiator family protein [Peptoanaerobacter stomatis]EHL18123.1 cell division protein FtsL [Peptoanaerobacter stomatis]
MKTPSYKNDVKSMSKNSDEKKERNDKKPDKDYSMLLVKGIIAVCIFSLLITIYNQKREISALNSIYKDVEYEYKEKEEELKELKKELKMVDSHEFIEKQAREKLKMVKPNEKVYVDTSKSNKEKTN